MSNTSNDLLTNLPKKVKNKILSRLIELTRSDKIIWLDEISPFSNNHFHAVYKDIALDTEWLQDNTPELLAKPLQGQEVLIKNKEVSPLILEIKKYLSKHTDDKLVTLLDILNS